MEFPPGLVGRSTKMELVDISTRGSWWRQRWAWWSCPPGLVGGDKGGVSGYVHQGELVETTVEMVELSTEGLGWKPTTLRTWWNIVHLLGGICGPTTLVEIYIKKMYSVTIRL
jgi:hypothetical protein